ncbi:MAG: hypothetical protein M3680_19675 [Myxococcota bacterium]|nr:hypothetical protein [Myxococcota bacterium]
MAERDDSKRRLLRTVCLIAGALGVAMLGLGALPGLEVYADARNCLGHAFAGVFSHGGSSSACEPHYVLDHTERVLAEPLAWLALIAIVGFGVLVWFRPKLRYALLWSLVTIGLGALALVAMFDLRLFEHTVALWPSRAFGVLALALFFHLIAVVPIACACFAWLTRTRPEPPPELPRATLVDRR